MSDVGDDICTELRALNHMACYMVYIYAVHQCDIVHAGAAVSKGS